MAKYKRRPSRRRQRYAYDDEYEYPYRRRRNGCLASIRRFIRNLVIVVLTAVGAIVLFILVLLIAFNFSLFVQILSYILYIAAGLAALGVIYLIVRIVTAISQRFSTASAARARAKLEHERARVERQRVSQAQVQVRSQESKLYREERVFQQKYGSPELQSPRRIHMVRQEGPPQGVPLTPQMPRRTRTLAEYGSPPPMPQPSAPPALAPKSALEMLGMPRKGQIFLYRDYQRTLRPGQIIVGIRSDGSPRLGAWDDFKILLILGSSSSGKSTTTLEKCLCIARNGGQLIICDPGGFKDDSVTRRLGPLEYALMPGTMAALEHADIMQNVECFRLELERRRRGADMSVPILLVIDELNGLLMDKEIKKDLTELIEKFAQQARGYNMFMVLCAQRASGLSTIRNSVISFICHRSAELEAAKILPSRYAKLAPELSVGQTLVCDMNGEIEALQQTFLEPEDIEHNFTRRPRRSTVPVPSVSRQTETIAPRVYGAPARQAAHHQQKLILRKANFVAEQPAPGQPVMSATWGEEPTLQQPPQRDTEDLTSRLSNPSRPGPPPSASSQPLSQGKKQDTFEMLALKRKKK